MAMLAELIKALAATGATVEQIAAAVEAVENQQLAQEEARLAAKREKDAQRKRKSRAKQELSRDVTVTPRDTCDTSPSDKESPQTPKEINSLSKENPPKGGQKKGSPDDHAALAHVWPADAWERWYGAYPHKVGKGAAEAAFEKIRRSGKVPFEALMAGLEVYRRTKPAHVDWCNPATWLNQKRWEDAPATAAARPVETEAERRARMQRWV